MNLRSPSFLQLAAFVLVCIAEVACQRAERSRNSRDRRRRSSTGTVSSSSSSSRHHRDVGGRRAISTSTSSNDDATKTLETTNNNNNNNNDRPKMWPPWPFSMLSAPRSSSSSRGADSDSSSSSSSSSSYPSGASLFWSFTTASANVGLQNVKQFGSNLWFHLPPAAPPLILLASIPRRRQQQLLVSDAATTATGAAQAVATKTFIPLFSNPFARTLALSGIGLAIMSWAQYELYRKRLLTPLPLRIAPTYRDLNRAILPPFLPDEVPIVVEFEEEEDDNDDDQEEALQSSSSNSDESSSSSSSSSSTTTNNNKIPPKLRQHWNQFLRVAALPKKASSLSPFKEWGRMRQERKLQRHNARRLATYEELVALQTLKKKAAAAAAKKRKRSSSRQRQNTAAAVDKEESEEDPLGYALVTGASRGIGRAIAVELARWEIPLILVARDVDRLTSLAYDLEACYGIKCCVLQADLSKPGAAESIYQTTHKAGLTVDVLVNNAGISSQGLSVDLPIESVDNMIDLNVMAVSTLTHLFGKDMKERRRGRILIVSSICGATAGIASVAVYSATKAFEKTLALSMAKEMEPYGVGVTCLLPGAVSETEFRSRSNSEEALCWKVPFYPLSPPQVADVGVRAMLRGETEVTPGWMNRVFLKVMKPALPQRIHNSIAETMWKPFHLPFSRSSTGTDQAEVETPIKIEAAEPSKSPPSIRSLYSHQAQPRLLQLEDIAPMESTTSAYKANTANNDKESSIQPSDDSGAFLNATQPQQDTTQPQEDRDKIDAVAQPQKKKDANDTAAKTVSAEDESS